MTSIDQLRLQGVRVIAGIYAVSAIALLAGSLLAGVPVFGIAGMGLAAAPLYFAMNHRSDKMARIALGAGLPLIAALALAISRGTGYLLDTHMLFFALLSASAIMADWRAVIAGTLVTAAHHLLLNFAAPTYVFTGGSDLVRVVIHALIVLIEAGVLVVLCNRIETLVSTIVETDKLKSEQEALANTEREQNSKEQAAVLDALKTRLMDLAGGNLTVQLAQLPGRYRQVETDFNSAIHSLDSAVGTIVDGFDQMASGTQEIQIASQDLARRTEQQAANLEETAAAINNVTSEVGRAAEAALVARTAITSTNGKADNGSTIVNEAVGAMDQIAKSSAEITNIIGVIDSIAFQTNLLALNAGVEAARAGETGKGFAVVASEVRALAQRCTQAADEVKQLISASGRHVETGVDLVSRSGAAFASIAKEVSELNSSIEMIANSAQSQAETLKQINLVVSELDGSTQQNAAMAEQCTAAAASLAAQASRLKQTVSRFETSQAAAQAMPARLVA